MLATYARQTGLPLDRGLVGNLASAVADPVIAKILSRVALAQFLQNGWPVHRRSAQKAQDRFATALAAVS